MDILNIWHFIKHIFTNTGYVIFNHYVSNYISHLSTSSSDIVSII